MPVNLAVDVFLLFFLVAEDISFGGTYKGKAAMGLLWSMRPVPGSRKALR